MQTFDLALVNIMPDAALVATERQFRRLMKAPGLDVRMHCVDLDGVVRGTEAAAHVRARYRDLAWLRAADVDAVVCTGTNVADPDLTRQAFWPALTSLLEWADRHAPAMLCSCLATHAALQHLWGRRRHRMPAKAWGVLPHEIVASDHPLTAGLVAPVPVPHSRWNDISAADFAAAGHEILLAGRDAGVHLAADPVRRWVFWQGHPEYDPVSLLKEHKREVARHVAGQRADWPEIPAGYLDAAGEARAARLRDEIAADGAVPYPEEELLARVVDSWTAAAEAVTRNWLQLAAHRRRRRTR